MTESTIRVAKTTDVAKLAQSIARGLSKQPSVDICAIGKTANGITACAIAALPKLGITASVYIEYERKSDSHTVCYKVDKTE